MEKSKTVKLISQEGFEFIVDYDAACVSNTVKNMLSSQGVIYALLQRTGFSVSSPTSSKKHQLDLT